MASEDALREEIERLSGAINRHKTGGLPGNLLSSSSRGNAYVNPSYRPPSRPTSRSAPAIQRPGGRPPPVRPREVVIDGVAFQSSKRSLVRKDLAKPPPVAKPSFKQVQPPLPTYAKKYPGTRAVQRPYKSKASRRIPLNHNMTLDNQRKPVRMGRKIKSMKQVDKQCPRFSTTGVCPKGLTCLYKHDPSKIAICWIFLHGNCPNTAESCSLSHDPTPERTPLCVHFANNGRCKNGDSCLFPHVRVGPRNGVCRDFAVLGYCDTGIDCEHQHVRECPDFAEKGACSNPRCKLPHVIRANQRRADAAKATVDADVATPVADTAAPEESSEDTAMTSADDAKIGDEYISLTFHESEESSEASDGSEGEGEEGEANDEDEDAEGDTDEEEESDSNETGDIEVHA